MGFLSLARMESALGLLQKSFFAISLSIVGIRLLSSLAFLVIKKQMSGWIKKVRSWPSLDENSILTAVDL